MYNVHVTLGNTHVFVANFSPIFQPIPSKLEQICS